MIVFNKIGVIRTPHKDRAGAPVQPAGAAGFNGRVELFPEYAQGLDDLDGFDRIILIYHFHLSTGFELKVIPFLDKTPRGLFATRAPKRPNQVGLSIVRLLRIEGAVIHIGDVDILDNSPLIDIKPYVPKFDAYPDARAGWVDISGDQVETIRSDQRFVDTSDRQARS